MMGVWGAGVCAVMWEVYKPGWGLADWKVRDIQWEGIDEVLPEMVMDLSDHLPSWGYKYLSEDECVFFTNLYATPLGRYDRWAVTPEDLRLANCANIIKRGFRRASNDPDYRMCRARIMPPSEEFDALCNCVL